MIEKKVDAINKMLKKLKLTRDITAFGASGSPASLPLVLFFGNGFTESTANGLKWEPGSEDRVKPVIVSDSETKHQQAHHR